LSCNCRQAATAPKAATLPATSAAMVAKLAPASGVLLFQRGKFESEARLLLRGLARCLDGAVDAVTYIRCNGLDEEVPRGKQRPGSSDQQDTNCDATEDENTTHAREHYNQGRAVGRR
jgi:hypothetical protein